MFLSFMACTPFEEAPAKRYSIVLHAQKCFPESRYPFIARDASRTSTPRAGNIAQPTRPLAVHRSYNFQRWVLDGPSKKLGGVRHEIGCKPAAAVLPCIVSQVWTNVHSLRLGGLVNTASANLRK